MKFYCKWTYFLVFILVCFSFKAQQYYFKNYSSESGMPFVQVNALYQDQKGFLYAGGYGGITRFDGKDFLTITSNQGLPDNNVNAIAESKEGYIIVGTKKGIRFLKDGRVVQDYRFAATESKNVNCLLVFDDNTLYAGTEDGIYVKDKNGERLLPGTENTLIKQLEWADNTVFAATNKGLMEINGKARLKHTVKNGLSSDHITCLAYNAKAKTLAIGTSNGLNLFNTQEKKFVKYFIENGLLDNSINCVKYDGEGDVWIGTPGGLQKLNPKNNTFTYYNIYYDNNSNLIRCFWQDFEKNLWVGTHSGMYRYRDNSFSTFDKISGPGNAFIFEIFRHSNNIYLCSENNGVYEYSEGYFKRYGIKDGLPDLVCRSGTVDKNNRVFFETETGIVELKNGKFYPVVKPKSIISSSYKLFCDSKNKVWIGGKNGMGWFSYNKGQKPDTGMVYLNSSEGEYEVTDICEDEQEKLWVVAYPGHLFCYNNGTVIDYGAKLGLKQIEYVSVRAHKHWLYVATLNGLLIINQKENSYRLLNAADGLISEIIYAIGFARNNKVLWIGSNTGVSQFDIELFESNGEIKIRSFSKNEGFTGIECNTNGILEDEDGTVWFGTVSGLIKHIPGEYVSNNELSKTHILRIRLGDTDTLLNSGSKLEYRNNNISFYYRGICLTNPEKVLYATKLEGYDKEYSAASEENFSNYTNLAPGTYTFKVISCNNEGAWNIEPASFVFTVLTPFYKTWWFVLSAMLSSVMLLIFIFRFRIQRIRNRQQKEYERKVELSKVELKALRSQMNPHFVFNSLNSIQHYIFNSKSDEAVKYLNKFAKLMRVILNNSDKPTVAIEDDLEALKLYLELEQMRFEDKFEYKIEIDGNVDLDYDIMPPMLLQPYVENAILHGLTPKKEKGLLTIGVRTEDQFIVCTITDNGIGRKKAAEIKRTMPGSKHKSMGMKITEERLRILNEISLSKHSVKIIDLEDEHGKAIGTRVEIFVPIV
jgi:ligand-binding sensor domain-containing protein